MALAAPVLAQNVSSYGQSWNGSWGFATPTDRSLVLQQAQIIDGKENPAPKPQTNVTYTTNYDNRSNYVEVEAGDGTVTTDLHVGDEIGQQTYAVGSLNTGNTTVKIEGDGNDISAVNSAETNGCVDGSILDLAMKLNTDPIAGSDTGAPLADVGSVTGQGNDCF